MSGCSAAVKNTKQGKGLESDGVLFLTGWLEKHL